MNTLTRQCILVVLSLALSAMGQEEKPKLTLSLSADFLALHLKGKAPTGSTAVEYRFAESGEISETAAWRSGETKLAPDGSFTVSVPLQRSVWSALEVRSLKGSETLATKKTRFRPDELDLLTPERVAALPEPQRKSWSAYLEKSQQRAAADFAALAAECRALGLANSKPAPSGGEQLELDSDTPETWFASEEAKKLADAIISYQTPAGGWSKAVNYAQGKRPPGTHWTSGKGDAWHYCGTIDNRSTTEQIKLLAGVYAATQRTDARDAALRGIDYLLEAQYPNGGWPQNYPIESGYHEAITLNDNAMLHVLEILLNLTEKKPPFTWADDTLKARAASAFQRGLDCLTVAQVKVKGQLTVWCAQHDPISLEPVRARAKEPPSLSGSESAEFIKFLMRKAPITAQTTAMIEPALAWIDARRVIGLRKTKNVAGKTDYVNDPNSKEIYWARFYDVETAKPMFAGAQDGIVYDTFSEMAAKNKVAYDFLTTKPGDLLSKELPRWKKRMEKEK
jgi:PelA/Pel-15E family pectate lyase